MLFSEGSVVTSDDWRTVHESYVRSIRSIDHPAGSGTFTLRQRVKIPSGKYRRNGVDYHKSSFRKHMVNVECWQDEGDIGLRNVPPPPVILYPSMEEHYEKVTSDFGPIDLVTTAPNGTRVAIEWETGNISSSHRSMNKLAIALEAGVVSAGVLIVQPRPL